MITDEIKIKVQAGRGGDGVVAFNKIKMSLGPTGGRGGKGGSVYFQGVSDLTALNKYKRKKDYWAPDGKNGGSDKSTGHDGQDLILTVPIGSVIKNLQTSEEVEIIQDSQMHLAAKGGIGGRGNFYFRSPINTSPQEAEKGREGESFEFFIELRLIADIGLIGLPNAGKSSLLNELTNAKAKVANYEFTTLEPNLGVMENLIIADIPGLIEGASRGKGLGIKFLKHIQRTKVLVHCISAETSDWRKDCQVIRQELGDYNKKLLEKKELILLTKSDLLTPAEIDKITKEMKDQKMDAHPVSMLDPESLKKVKENISKIINN
jgi:GTPase